MRAYGTAKWAGLSMRDETAILTHGNTNCHCADLIGVCGVTKSPKMARFLSWAEGKRPFAPRIPLFIALFQVVPY